MPSARRGHGTCWCPSLFSNFSAPSGTSTLLLTWRAQTTETPGKLLLSLPPPILRTRSAKPHRRKHCTQRQLSVLHTAHQAPPGTALPTHLCASPDLARTDDSDAREAPPQPPTANPLHALCQNAPTKHCTQRQLSALHTAHHAPPGTALPTHLCPSPDLARTDD